MAPPVILRNYMKVNELVILVIANDKFTQKEIERLIEKKKKLLQKNIQIFTLVEFYERVLKLSPFSKFNIQTEKIRL